MQNRLGRKRAGLIAFSVAALTAFVVAQRVGSGPPADSATVAARQFDVRARAECKAAIQSQLKSPKSASFENTESGPTLTDTTRFVVRGDVTAVNAFNAPLTKRYACEFDLSGRMLSADIRER